jgi:putative oxidoreductase
MNALTTSVARILFAVPFAVFGLLHLMSANNMAGMVPSWIPGGVFWVYLIGLALIAAAISIIMQKKAKLASLLLAALLAIFILTIHLPGIIGAANDMAMMMSMSGFLKDLGLAGGALTYAGISKD